MYLIILCWLFPFRSTAQDKAPGKSQFSKINILEGLKVKCILQDKQGFQWLGTETGLYRYDGYNTELISTTSAGIQLSANVVLSLHEDRQSNLWIGTANGLQRLSPDRKSITAYLIASGVTAEAKKAINAITQIHDGSIWCSADDGYLYRSTDNKTFSLIPESYAADYTGLQRVIRSISQDDTHQLWLADVQHGFRKLNPESLVLQDYSLPHNRLLLACYAGTSVRLLANQRNIFVYAPYSNAFVQLENVEKSGLLKNPVRYIYQDKKNFIWLVTQSELLRLDPKTKQIEDFTSQFMDSGAPYFQIECMYEDANEQLWIGSYFGVYKINNRESLFKTISLPKGIGAYPYFSTRGLLESADGDLFIGSYSGLFRYNRALNTFKEYKIKVDNTWVNPLTRAMVGDSNGNIWMATEALGLLHYNPHNQTFTPYLHKPKATAKNKTPIVSTHNFSLLKDTQEQLWLGGYNNLYTLDPQSGQTELFDFGAGKKILSLLQILALHQGRDNTIWVGTDYGLYHIKKGQGVLAHYTSEAEGGGKSGLSHNFINCIYEDKKGRLWLGTKGGGINVFNPENGRIEACYTAQDGLADDRICAILPGAENQLWISTFNGLSLLLLPGKSFRNFYMSDGLPTNEFNQGSALAGTDGNLYFGSMDGITFFNPNNFLKPGRETSTTDAQVMLTKLIQHNGIKNKIEETTLAIQSLQQIRLHYQDNFFTVYFARKNLIESPSGHHQFAYRLAGISNQWQNIGQVNYIQFAGLPAGDYLLSIKAMDSNGIWGKELQIPVLVGQAFYLSTAAYVLYALVFIVIVCLIFWFQLGRVRLQNQLALEYMQKEKLQEIDELKTRFFTNITHEFRTPLTLIISPLEQLQSAQTLPPSQIIRQQHTLMYRNAQRLLRLISQLLDSAKLEAGSMPVAHLPGDVAAFIGQRVETFRMEAQKKAIQLQYTIEENPATHLFDSEKLEEIIYNLLSNALKFTPEGGTVQVDLTWSKPERAQEVLNLQVTDTGIGIPTLHLPLLFERFYQVNDLRMRSSAGSGLGLYLVKALTELMGGQVTVQSQVEKGTTFRVILPLQVTSQLIPAAPVVALSSAIAAEEATGEQPLPKVGSEAPLVLVVEDHEELRAFISEGLAGKYRVMVAGDGQAGWQITQQELPDLVISDVAMPLMDGFTMSRLIKSTPLTTHIPVILLTARTSAENRVQGLSSGAIDYLTKPFNLQELQVRVANWFSYQQTLRQYWYHKFTKPNAEELPVSLPDKPAEDPFLLEVYQLLDRELANAGFAVDQLAAEMRVSTRTLHRKVTALTAMNASTLIRSYRLSKAADYCYRKDMLFHR
jgi:signal transduction histidine kinase/ligand-binding sensor domain-containing protein/DNA-binding response OmpR family regulator